MAKQISMKSFDKQSVVVVEQAMMAALKPLEQQLGVKFVARGGRFGSLVASLKIDVRLEGAEASTWNKYCGHFDLEPKDCGTVFTNKKYGESRMVGINPRRTKFPIECISSDGKTFYIPDTTAKFHVRMAANVKSKKLTGSSEAKTPVEKAEAKSPATKRKPRATAPKAVEKAPAKKVRATKTSPKAESGSRGRPKQEGSRAERRAARAAAKAAAEKKSSRSTARKPAAKPVATKRAATKKVAAKAAPKSPAKKTARRRRSAV